MELKQKLKEIVNSGRAIALKMPWTNYLKEFKIATRANEWSEKEQAINLTIAYRGDAFTIPVQDMDDFEQLKNRINKRYSHEHFQQECRLRNMIRPFKNTN